MAASEKLQSYSSEQIQEILNLAIARQANCEEFSRQQLEEIANEIGIDSTSLNLAEQEWLQRKTAQQQRQAFNLYRRNLLQQKFTKYVIVNIFLVSLNLLVASSLTWVVYVMMFWGLSLVLQTWKIYFANEQEYEKAFQRWNFRNELKQTASSLWQKLQRSLQV